jgi:hypothetical protein
MNLENISHYLSTIPDMALPPPSPSSIIERCKRFSGEDSTSDKLYGAD